jgi:hypothetical protein
MRLRSSAYTTERRIGLNRIPSPYEIFRLALDDQEVMAVQERRNLVARTIKFRKGPPRLSGYAKYFSNTAPNSDQSYTFRP